MSERIQALDLKQARPSKIQIEVKEIAPQATSKDTTSHLGTDADGDDIRNE
jgi:hypothetical protein